jgi:anti-anti-sigma factor
MTPPLTHICGDCACATVPPEADLYVEVGSSGRVTTLRLHGTLNTYTIGMLADRVEAALKHGAVNLVVSLGNVPFLDAEGVGALLRARKRVQLGGGTLVLADAPEQARKTIAVKGLSIVLLCFAAEDVAVEFLTSWRAAP